MSVDPFPGYVKRPSTQHGYNYVGNNPINKIDPSGLCEQYLPDEACWSLYEQLVRRYPEARHMQHLAGMHGYPGKQLHELPANVLMGILRNFDSSYGPGIQPIIASGHSGIHAVIRFFDAYAGPANIRLEQLLRQTDILRFTNMQLPFGVPLPGDGLCEIYQDQQHYNSLWGGGQSYQTSHFLTAVALTYYNLDPAHAPASTSLYRLLGGLSRDQEPMMVALRLIIGHELVSDTAPTDGWPDGRIKSGLRGPTQPLAYPLQYNAATNAHVQSFITALGADMAGDTATRDALLMGILNIRGGSNAVEERTGNSFEDILLSLKGVEFGGLIRLGNISSSRDAATWLRGTLTE
jgi:hypothetical protein